MKIGSLFIRVPIRVIRGLIFFLSVRVRVGSWLKIDSHGTRQALRQEFPLSPLPIFFATLNTNANR
jgi:hypothetical protein